MALSQLVLFKGVPPSIYGKRCVTPAADVAFTKAQRRFQYQNAMNTSHANNNCLACQVLNITHCVALFTQLTD